MKHVLGLYGVSENITDCTEYLIGPMAMKFFEFVLVDMPNSTLLDAVNQLKPVSDDDHNKNKEK